VFVVDSAAVIDALTAIDGTEDLREYLGHHVPIEVR
jgi:hypothetical protein